MDFEGKRVLVTGAGQGIGRAIAIELLKKGACVFALSRTKEHLDSLKNEFPQIETIICDLSNWEQTKFTIQSLEGIDLLVNNAGVALLENFGEITEEAIDRSFSINFKAVVNVSQIVTLDMIKRGVAGSIVNISSQASMVALEKHAIYCASKAALDQLAKVMAFELGPYKIRVNNVNPTVVLTEMGKKAWGDPQISSKMKEKIPLRRFCEPQDVVNAVLFLLSNQSSMITGAMLPIDGGYTLP